MNWALQGGDIPRAIREYWEAIRILREHAIADDSFVRAIEGMAEIASQRGQPEITTRLLGVTTAWYESTGVRRSDREAAAHQHLLQLARKKLGNRAYDLEWTRASVLSISAAAELAANLELPDEVKAPPGRMTVPALVEQLTPQEHRILCLIASGLSNQKIADELGISVRRVTTHGQNIFGKLGVDNRTHAAAMSFHHGLCHPP